MNTKLNRRLVCEGVGTALLVAGVIGSGIMAQRLSGGNVALALLANTIATGGILVAIIAAFGPISGAHFNPAVSLSEAWNGAVSWREAAWYTLVQIAGAIAGAMIANVMFGLAPVALSHHARHGAGLLLGEAVATFGLLCVIRGCALTRVWMMPFAVAAYIVGAYWFTSSTSFANPAVAIGRSLTDTFAGIAPNDVPGFVIAQLAGAAAATALFGWLAPPVATASSPAEEAG